MRMRCTSRSAPVCASNRAVAMASTCGIGMLVEAVHEQCLSVGDVLALQYITCAYTYHAPQAASVASARPLLHHHRVIPCMDDLVVMQARILLPRNQAANGQAASDANNYAAAGHLVDEDDGGLVLLGQPEHVAHHAGPLAQVLLHKL